MKSFLLVLIGFAVSVVGVLSLVVFLAIFDFDANKIQAIFYQPKALSALTETNDVNDLSQDEATNGKKVLGSNTAVVSSDARASLVANFLKRYNSSNKAEGGFRDLNHPLVPEDYFGQFFVELADKYEMDFRLLPAIAMQESNLCIKTPKTLNEDGSLRESYNCLGFGVYGDKVAHFENFEANFEAAAKTLKKHYIDKGLDTPYKIMRKYTPPSDGSWAESVNQWMTEMRYDDRASGKALKTDADLLEFIDDASGSASASASM